MAKSPAFQFYPDSWLSSLAVTLMSPAEEGAYLRLLCHAWLSPDCGLPSDSESLKVLSRLGVGWSKSEAKIRSKFRLEGERLFNDRLLAERTKQEVWREKSRQGGKSSGASRREPNVKGGSILVGECLQPNGNSSSPSPSSSPVTTKEKTPTESKRTVSPAGAGVGGLSARTAGCVEGPRGALALITAAVAAGLNPDRS